MENVQKEPMDLVLRILTRLAEVISVLCLAVYYIGETILLTLFPSIKPDKNISGKTALVTGGVGGVGRQIVIQLAKQNVNVIVWDNNEKALEEFKEETKQMRLSIHIYAIDITDRESVYKHANMVTDEYGPIDILINNAGVVCGKTFLEIPDYMIEKTFNVNVISHYWTTKAFLPDMIKNKSGHIVTVGSLTGLLGTYNCVDYSATKCATIGFHESLLVELKTHGHNKINMTLVCPYFINTKMFAGCKPRTLPMLEPTDVAKRIIQAIKREEILVTMPTFARYVLPLKFYLPHKLWWALQFKIAQLPQVMMEMRAFKEVEAA